MTNIRVNRIRPGEALQLARASSASPSFVADQSLLDRVDLTICYCSITATCWIVDSRASDFPHATPQCPQVRTMLSY